MDRSFGDQGYARTPIDPQSLAIRSDDGIIAASRTDLEAYTADGQLDPSFDAGDIAVAGVTKRRRIDEIAVDQLNRILVAVALPHGRARLVRLDPDGSLDTTFGTRGVFELDQPPKDHLSYARVAIDPSGRIAFANFTLLAMLDPSGRPDSTFDTGPFEDHSHYTSDVGFWPDGALATASHSVDRYLPTGEFDSSFHPADIYYDPEVVLPTADGSLYATGEAESTIVGNGGSYLCFSLAQHFDPSGATIFQRSVDCTLRPQDPALDGEGRLLVTEYAEQGLSIGVRRLTEIGSSDPTFGRDGLASSYPGGCDVQPAAIGVQSDGGVIVAGADANWDDGGTHCHQGAIVKLTAADDGPSDADADGINDDADDCRLGAGPAPNGCPMIRQRLVAQGWDSGHHLRGRLRVGSDACIRPRVHLRVERLGAKTRVYHANPVVFSGKWKMPRFLPAGRYLVSTPLFHRLDRANCMPARDRVRLE
jgi:uncharacterized delta-60 repeat protein